MKITFKNKKDESDFKKFVCQNKEILKTFFSFGAKMKNPISRLIFVGLISVLEIICPN